MKRRIRHGRKLLVASLGVAAVSYVACGGNTTSTSGNLMPPEAGADHPQQFDVVGNLVAPGDAAKDHVSALDVVANLVAPPVDASDAGKAGDAQQEFSVFDVVANLAIPPDGGP